MTADTKVLTPARIAHLLGIPRSEWDQPLSAPRVAELIGVRPDTWWGYVTRARTERAAGRDRPGLAPPEDGRETLSNRPYWMPETIARYKLARVGPGKRMDLEYDLPAVEAGE
jgi:hypothetical protein